MKKKHVQTSDEEFLTSDSEGEFAPLHPSLRMTRKEKATLMLERMPKYVCSFFCLGATLSAPLAVTICSAEDMLSGTLYATGWVLMAASAPSCLVKLLFLLCSRMNEISLVGRVLSLFIFMITGLLLVAFSITDIRLRLAGVCLISTGTAIGEVALLTHSATKFQEVALGSYIAGTATGGVLSALPYVGMTSWSDVNPRAALLVPVLWPSILLLVFAMMQTNSLCKKPPKKHLRQEIYQYESRKQEIPFWLERFLAVWRSFEHLALMFLAYFSVYLSLCAILSTLVFSPSEDFHPREDFQHYVLSTLLGEFLGRSFMSLLRAQTPGINYRIPSLCGIFAILFMLLFVFAVWYHFIYRIWIVFVLCFMQGANSGIMASNSYHAIANRTLAEHTVFLLVLASMLESLGIFTAGLFGLQTEPALMKHCLELQSINASHCLSRSSNAQLWTQGKSILLS